ncbi:LAMI_0E02718g1_1 [Lachancea mirantina]|uniref:LAMI_0E02718g1_1 n=1 Tax=Lachancea mirantina TaxID=1230905 RepID=A0A1G4JJM9_9SACH|nr:LAMI_0E02718g1_1 [Lachancea mirantina]
MQGFKNPRLIIRQLSSTIPKRPLFDQVFPQKKLINKILFELDSKLNYGTLLPAYESVYDGMNKLDREPRLPTSFVASDVMVMKKVLEKVRRKSKSINVHLLALENALLEKAAEMGDNDGIALLAFEVLKDASKQPVSDVEHAKKLIKELKNLNHPLTLKLTGDLVFKLGDYNGAENWYKRFLKLEDETYLAGEVYQQLGVIYFKKAALQDAENSFLKSVKFCPLERVVHSYYYLAQIYLNSDPIKARFLMESAATEGFVQSFRALGFLEKDYFQNNRKALEWFRLGMELLEVDCFIGYFDCCIQQKDWQKASKCLKSLEEILGNHPNARATLAQFKEKRKATINSLESERHLGESSIESAKSGDNLSQENETRSRWDL